MKLGPYEIHSPLGAGGMGEVYRARDTRLERTVAIKILPAHLSSDPVCRQRFEREARTISSLNHPHICVLHDIGHQDGMDYLVMECVEGETLEKRLEKGPLPVEQVVKIGAEVADALGRAHRSGVVHRDLKPGNIMLTSTGVKLLDFGLAKPVAPLGNAATLTAAASAKSPVTEQGTIVGTFQYMSPEQVEGREVDGRSDIFSLGAVLYEMVTGRRAFEGKSQLSVASAILEKEPEPIAPHLLRKCGAAMTARLQRLVRRCLEKDPEKRWQAAADLAFELQWIASGAAETDVQAQNARLPRITWAWAPSIIAALIAGSAVTYWLAQPQPRPVVRTSILSPSNSRGFQFSGEGFGAAVLAPDGRRIAFTAVGDDGKRRLWVRALDATTAQELSGTEGANHPFWSPDSRYIGFFAERKLKKIMTAGGAMQVLCDAGAGRGGTWNASGVIVFSPDVNSPLYRVSDIGGRAEAATRRSGEESSHIWPYFLTDGKHYLFTIVTPGRPTRVWVGSLDGTPPKQLFDAGWNAVFANPGYVLFIDDGMLMARPFDPGRLDFTGSAVRVGEAPNTSGEQMNLSVSNTGDLLYQSAGLQPTMEWRDHHGKVLGELADAGFFFEPRIAPSGNMVAVSLTVADKADVYLLDLARRGARTRLTFEPGNNTRPVWYPDGKRLALASNSNGKNQLFTKPISGMASEEPLLQDEYDDSPASISADGHFLAFMRRGGASGKVELWILPLNEKGQPVQFQPLPVSNRGNPMFSPDGHWLAYTSDESGRREVYIAPFPATNEKWQVSTDGGQLPAWAPNSKELFYVPSGDDAIMSVAVALGPAPHLGTPQKMFSVPVNVAPPGTNYDVSPDGTRFLIMTLPENPGAPLTLVQNWNAALKR